MSKQGWKEYTVKFSPQVQSELEEIMRFYGLESMKDAIRLSIKTQYVLGTATKKSGLKLLLEEGGGLQREIEITG